MNTRHRLALVCAALAAVAPCPGEITAPGADSLPVDFSVSTDWVRNLSHTTDGPSRTDAATDEFSLGTTRSQQLASNWLADYGADLDGLMVPAFDRNSLFRGGLRAGVKRKFGVGPFAPVVRFEGSVRYVTARISSDSGWLAEGGVRLTRRLSPEWQLAAGANGLRHAAHGAAFAVSQWTYSAEVTWTPADRWQVRGTVSRLEARSSATPRERIGRPRSPAAWVPPSPLTTGPARGKSPTRTAPRGFRTWLTPTPIRRPYRPATKSRSG